MPRTKSIKHCPRCGRDLPVDAFDKRPDVHGRSNGYRPRCRECTRAHGDSLLTATIRGSITPPNPSGLCQCGCGQRTPMATQSSSQTGDVRGTPRRFMLGHGNSKDPCRAENYRIDAVTGCWVWLKAKSSGYGMTCYHGRQTLAHRVFYERFVGPIPDGLQLDHLCRNRACVNPAHLEPVTIQENVRRGDGTRLTPDDVREIRRLWATGEYTRRQLGERFGIASTTVEMVVYFHNWKDV